MTCLELFSLLSKSIEMKSIDSLLLSGGLESTILAYLIKPKYAITTSFGSFGDDKKYSDIVGKKYCKTHKHFIAEVGQILNAIENIIKLFKTFDPIEVRNSAVLFLSLKELSNDGYDSAYTGDGGDELFGGYNYLTKFVNDKVRLTKEIHRIWKVMEFSSFRIGNFLSVSIYSPFLNAELKRYVQQLDCSQNVGYYNGGIWGKLILRKCFHNQLGSLVWRKKQALEEGSGFNRIGTIIEDMVNDDTYKKGIDESILDGVSIRNKEHFYYYQLYRKYFDPPIRIDKDKFPKCPKCNGYITSDRYCKICGAYPIVPLYSHI